VTAVPLALPHRNALLAALTPLSQRQTGPIAIGEGGAPDPVPKSGLYAVLYVSPGRRLPASLMDDRTVLSLPFQVTSVGPTAERALWVADRVAEALAPLLTIDGRTAWRVEEQGGPALQRDDGVTPPVYYLPVQYRLSSIAS
jgi:hypothetical protein